MCGLRCFGTAGQGSPALVLVALVVGLAFAGRNGDRGHEGPTCSPLPVAVGGGMAAASTWGQCGPTRKSEDLGEWGRECPTTLLWGRGRSGPAVPWG